MRLIDADALNESMLTAEMGKVYKFCFPCKKMQQAIDEQPIIDAVEVVRCKDCKRRQKDTIFHKLYCDGREVVADGYCWKGEQDD